MEGSSEAESSSSARLANLPFTQPNRNSSNWPFDNSALSDEELAEWPLRNDDWALREETLLQQSQGLDDYPPSPHDLAHLSPRDLVPKDSLFVAEPAVASERASESVISSTAPPAKTNSPKSPLEAYLKAHWALQCNGFGFCLVETLYPRLAKNQFRYPPNFADMQFQALLETGIGAPESKTECAGTFGFVRVWEANVVTGVPGSTATITSGAGTSVTSSSHMMSSPFAAAPSGSSFLAPSPVPGASAATSPSSATPSVASSLFSTPDSTSSSVTAISPAGVALGPNFPYMSSEKSPFLLVISRPSFVFFKSGPPRDPPKTRAWVVKAIQSQKTIVKRAKELVERREPLTESLKHLFASPIGLVINDPRPQPGPFFRLVQLDNALEKGARMLAKSYIASSNLAGGLADRLAAFFEVRWERLNHTELAIRDTLACPLLD